MKEFTPEENKLLEGFTFQVSRASKLVEAPEYFVFCKERPTFSARGKDVDQLLIDVKEKVLFELKKFSL